MKKKIVAVIAAKKKSNRLKNKNILPINGKPMFLHVADEIKKSKYINEIIISSDSKFIKKISIRNGYTFVSRPKKLTYEKADNQDVVVNAIKKIFKKKIKPKFVISIQPNSPEIKFEDLNKALFFEKKLYPRKSKRGYSN